MDRKSVYQLRDIALNTSRLVFNYNQLSRALGYERSLVKVYASRLVKRGLASKIADGIISFTDDRFIIATQLVEPSYISMTSALYLQELILQAPSYVECITTHGTKRILEIEYHKIHPKLFFGYERKERGAELHILGHTREGSTGYGLPGITVSIDSAGSSSET